MKIQLVFLNVLVMNTLSEIVHTIFVFLECSKEISESTHRKTQQDMGVFCQFLRWKNEHRAIQDIAPTQLNVYICQFLTHARKKNGSRYESVSLRGFLSSIIRHLKNHHSPMSIMKDTEFFEVRKMLKTIPSPDATYSQRPKFAVQLTMAEIELMYKAKTLGTHTPRSLLHSIWLICVLNFGLYKAKEIKQVQWGDIQCGLDETTGAGYLYLNTRRFQAHTGLTTKNSVFNRLVVF